MDDLYQIAGVVAAIISGVNFVIVNIAKAFWKLTFEQEAKKNKEKFEAMSKRITILEAFEDKNKNFRHNFNSVTQGLQEHITREIKHLEEIIELKFEIFTKGKK